MANRAAQDRSRTVAELMTQDVERIAPEATLKEAAQKMKQHDTGILPVCDGGAFALSFNAPGSGKFLENENRPLFQRAVRLDCSKRLSG